MRYQYGTTIDAGVLGEVDITVEYEFTPGLPAKISGPPEDCYPEEDPEIEIYKVWIDGGPQVTNVFDWDFLFEKLAVHGYEQWKESDHD